MPPIKSPISTSGWEMSKPDSRVAVLRRLLAQLLDEGREQHERREHGRADRVALGHRLGRVADRVERIGHVADVLRQVGHLGDAAGVVGDRTERVEGDDQARERQLGHDGHADAVDAGQLVRHQDAEREQDCRRGGRLEALSEPLDDVRGVPGLRGPRGRAHRPEARRRVVVGDHEQARGYGDADERAEIQVDARRGLVRAAAQQSGDVVLEGEVVHHPERDREEGQRGQHGRHDQALVEGPLHVPGGAADRVGADDRGDQRDAADHERVDGDSADLLEGEDAEQHHRDGGDRVGLEEVGRHAGAVADVVAHVVRDHSRVARVVLRDARLDLADEVGADVGGLREDAAAQAGEDGDQRTAEAEPDQGVDRVALLDVERG